MWQKGIKADRQEPQYTAELHDLVVIMEKLSLFHTSFPISPGQHAAVKPNLGLSLCMLQKRTLCCAVFFFPHNTKTNRTVRTGAHSKLATSFVDLVFEAP